MTSRGSDRVSEPAEMSVAQRTHTWLRLSLVGVVVVVFAAVAVESVRIGGILPSVSHYYYSPARNALVGALIAASMALLALSGRNFESALLDLAAPLAPLVALVPTRVVITDVPGAAATCPAGRDECVPQEVIPDVVNGVTVYLAVLGILVVTGVVRAVKSGPSQPGEFGPRRRITVAVVGGAVVGVGVLVAAVIPAATGQPPLLTLVHFAAAGLFLLAVGSVAILNAFWRTDARQAPGWERVVYIVIATLLLIDLAVAVWAVWFAQASTAVFWVEMVALALIAAFFAVQTVQRRGDEDPPSLRAHVQRLAPLRPSLRASRGA